jgi:hypothetical protein
VPFPFSLHDRAKAWLDSNMSGSITSWDNLLTKFYNKFFPISKVNECRKEISSFSQEEDEKFFESWERVKRYVNQVPSTWIQEMKTRAVLLLRIDSIQPQHDHVNEWRRISEFNRRKSI